MSGKTDTDTSSAGLAFGPSDTLCAVRVVFQSAGAAKRKWAARTVCSAGTPPPPPPQPASAAASRAQAPARVRSRIGGTLVAESRRKDSLAMPMTKDSVMSAAETARPYVERALRDEAFRDNLRAAFAAARALYEELSSQRDLSSLATRVARDEDVQQHIRRAIAELRHAAERLQHVERERAGSHRMRNLAFLLGGVAIGVFFNPFTGPETRRWVKGKVLGAHEMRAASPNGGSAHVS